MNYPKPVMSITELVRIGFSRNELKNLVHAWDQNFATPTSGGGKWMIDTARLEKYLEKRRNQSGGLF